MQSSHAAFESTGQQAIRYSQSGTPSRPVADWPAPYLPRQKLCEILPELPRKLRQTYPEKRVSGRVPAFPESPLRSLREDQSEEWQARRRNQERQKQSVGQFPDGDKARSSPAVARQ